MYWKQQHKIFKRIWKTIIQLFEFHQKNVANINISYQLQVPRLNQHMQRGISLALLIILMANITFHFIFDYMPFYSLHGRISWFPKGEANSCLQILPSDRRNWKLYSGNQEQNSHTHSICIMRPGQRLKRKVAKENE